MESLSFDSYSSDPVMVVAQSLVGAADIWADMTDFSFKTFKTESAESGTIVSALTQNIQLLSALSDGQHGGKCEAVRSGLPKQCEDLRIFFADVIYKQIISEVESRYSTTTISSTSKPRTSHCNHFNVHIYYREAKGTKNTDGPNEELLLLLYLTTILISSMIQFEHNTLTKSTRTTSSVFSHKNLAALSAVLRTLQGLCTDVSKNHTQVMQNNAQERMLLLRESAKALPKSPAGKVSMIEEVQTDSVGSVVGDSSDSIFEQISLELQVPPPYRTPYTSASLLHTIQPTNTYTTTTTLYSIVHTTITQLTLLCTTNSAITANRSTKAKSGTSVDSVVREDRSAVLTQSIINVAR